MIGRKGRAVALGVLLAGTAISCGTLKIRMAMGEGNRLYKAERYEEAIAEYKKILDIDPDHWDANYQIAMSYLAMYHPGSTHAKDKEYADRASEYFERLLTELEAPSPEVREKVQNYYLGLLTSADRADRAADYLQGLLAKDPRNTGLMAQLAQIYMKKGDFPSALKYYKMKAELEPGNKENWYTIGVLCWARSYHGKATVSVVEREQAVAEGMQAIEKALAIDPDYFEAVSYLNLLYRQKQEILQTYGKLQEAQEAYLKAEELLARAMELRKKQAQAAPAVEKAS